MARVLVPLAQGCEEIESVTIIDVLRRAEIEVVVAGLDAGPVTASRGTVLVPDVTLDAVLEEDFDMLVLPGGLPGADHLERDPRIQALLRRYAAADRYLAAICAAPKILAGAGLLDGKSATSYPGFLEKFPRVSKALQPVVIDGKLITSRGPGSAMDFALALVEALVGKPRRDQVEQGLAR
jgi:4-methyl-5(b-hydroxyethyl)-thiazole monophosphate biosynthesis